MFLILVFVALLGSLNGVFAQVQSEKDSTATEPRIPIEQLLAPRDYTRFVRGASYPQKMELLRKGLDSRVKRLKHEIPQTNLASIFRTLAEIRGLVHHGMEISLTEKNEGARRHREVKRLEIVLRKLREQLSTQQLEVPLENRGQFDITIDLTEELRNQLLGQLFGKAVEPRSDQPGSLNFLPRPGPFGAAASSSQGLHDMDKFTEEEFTKVQNAQELVKRVEVFLKIAESRLDEVDRRRKGIELDEKTPNPLEFYTYEDLLHAYFRAIEGIMVNIDARARSGGEEEKNIRKSLKKLDGQIDAFLKRLAEFKDLVLAEKDERLYRKYQEALDSSEIAKKGAHLGLGGADGNP